VRTGSFFLMAEPSFLPLFPYEYVSGVARLNSEQWGVEIYLVNRGGEDAMGRASVIEAENGDVDGVFANTERYNSDDQFVPPGHYGFSQFEPRVEFGLYWCRVVTTSRDLVPSVSFYRPSSDGAGSVPDFAFAPGDFAVFSPSSVPLRPIIGPPQTG
jgi:hypothetical protein